MAKGSEFACFLAIGEALPGLCHGRMLAGRQKSDGSGMAPPAVRPDDARRRKGSLEACPAPTRVLDTPPMSSERRKEIDRRRRRRERALKARKHEAIKAAAATKKKK